VALEAPHGDRGDLIMYEPGTLRPPTAAEMARRELALEYITIEHHMFCYPPADPAERAEQETYGYIDYACTVERHLDQVSAVSPADLLALCRDYVIPFEATLCTVDYEGLLGLSWDFLEECPGCGLWVPVGHQKRHEAEGVHAALVADRQRMTEHLMARAAEERERRDAPGGTDLAVSPRRAAELMAHFTVPPVDGLGPR
jgi:hypothetical protein